MAAQLDWSRCQLGNIAPMNRLPSVALVFLGGALGAIIRWTLTVWIPALGDPTRVPGAATPLNIIGGIPLGDIALLVVNVLGALLLGLLVGMIPDSAHPRRTFWGTGVLGGFTSFSSLAAAVDATTDSASTILIGGTYGVFTLALGLIAAAMGLRLGRDLNELARLRRAADGADEPQDPHEPHRGGTR